MITLLRKSMLVGLSTGFLFLTSPSAQLVGTMFLLSMGLALHFVVIPFRNHSNNLMEGLAMLGQLASCFGIMTRVGVGSVTTTSAGGPTGNVTEAEQLAFDWITILIAGVFVFFWLASLLDVLLFGGQLEIGLNLRFPSLMGWFKLRAADPESGDHVNQKPHKGNDAGIRKAGHGAMRVDGVAITGGSSGSSGSRDNDIGDGLGPREVPTSFVFANPLNAVSLPPSVSPEEDGGNGDSEDDREDEGGDDGTSAAAGANAGLYAAAEEADTFPHHLVLPSWKRYVDDDDGMAWFVSYNTDNGEQVSSLTAPCAGCRETGTAGFQLDKPGGRRLRRGWQLHVHAQDGAFLYVNLIPGAKPRERRTPPLLCEETDEHGTVFQLDKPADEGGRRLAPPWERMDNDAGEIWFASKDTGLTTSKAPLLQPFKFRVVVNEEIRRTASERRVQQIMSEKQRKQDNIDAAKLHTLLCLSSSKAQQRTVTQLAWEAGSKIGAAFKAAPISLAFLEAPVDLVVISTRAPPKFVRSEEATLVGDALLRFAKGTSGASRTPAARKLVTLAASIFCDDLKESDSKHLLANAARVLERIVHAKHIWRRHKFLQTVTKAMARPKAVMSEGEVPSAQAAVADEFAPGEFEAGAFGDSTATAVEEATSAEAATAAGTMAMTETAAAAGFAEVTAATAAAEPEAEQQTDGPGGRLLKAGWKRCEDETGDVWASTSDWSPPLAPIPLRKHSLFPNSSRTVRPRAVRVRSRRVVVDGAVCRRRRACEWAPSEEGLAPLFGRRRRLVRKRRRRKRASTAGQTCPSPVPPNPPLLNHRPSLATRSQPRPRCRWTPPYADDGEPATSGGAFQTDGPGGRRLKQGWHRCSDDEGDIVRTFSNYCCPAHTTRQPANPKKSTSHPHSPSLLAPGAVVRERRRRELMDPALL